MEKLKKYKNNFFLAKCCEISNWVHVPLIPNASKL